jgi:AraC-like DNA-binding protein
MAKGSITRARTRPERDRSLVPLAAAARDPRSDARTVELDAGVELGLHEVRGDRLRLGRMRATSRDPEPDAYRLLVVLDGSARFSHCGGARVLRRADLALYHASQPVEVERTAPGTPSTLASVTFPRERLALAPAAVEALIGEPLSGAGGVGAVVSDFVRRLAQEADRCTAADNARLATSAVDLAGLLLASRLHTDAARTRDAARQALLARVQSFVEARLGDPELGPEAIAEAHHVSVRFLHKLFRDHGLTVSGWLRQRRLERCRRDLADPLHADRPIHVIAARWGFRNDAHFNRAFRRAFGVTPGEWRARRHGTHPTARDENRAAGVKPGARSINAAPTTRGDAEHTSRTAADRAWDRLTTTVADTRGVPTMERNEAAPETDVPTTDAEQVEVLEIEDDLDTGMHRVNVCKHPS